MIFNRPLKLSNFLRGINLCKLFDSKQLLYDCIYLAIYSQFTHLSWIYSLYFDWIISNFLYNTACYVYEIVIRCVLQHWENALFFLSHSVQSGFSCIEHVMYEKNKRASLIILWIWFLFYTPDKHVQRDSYKYFFLIQFVCYDF